MALDRLKNQEVRWQKNAIGFTLTCMVVLESLQNIRTHWIDRISRELAQGENVRAGFVEQLDRFYEMLAQTVQTGDAGWLDPILFDWGKSSTETNLEKGEYEVSFILNRMIPLTIEVIRENLDQKQAIDTLTVVIPILSHCLSVVNRYEMESRVAHISNELGKAQTKLEELDRSKSNFISVAAHELKTPLTLIEGYTSMMADAIAQTSKDTPIDKMLKGVDTGIRRLRHIIDDMIDVSLIDNDLLSINLQPVWVSHLIKLLRNELAGAISERNQSLVIRDFEGDDIMIYGDTERLFQALHNVATNAIKYTPDKGTITVNGRLLPGFVEITVADTGIGISVEHQAIIFEKFGQLGRSDLHSSGKTKFKGGGPGLGLPIAKGILEAHGGSIWVESAGHDEVKLPGTTFHILLPTRQGPSDPVIGKLFSIPEKPTKETDPIAQEKPSTDNLAP